MINTPRSGDIALYGPIAQQYENVLVPSRFSSPALDLLKMIGPVEAKPILDVGTGTGVVLDHLAHSGYRLGPLIGIDPSAEMLGVARSKGHQRLAVAQSPGLPFGSGTYGLVVASFVLSHFDSLDESMADMVRVLAPHGTLGVSTWGDSDNCYREVWMETVGEFIDSNALDELVRAVLPHEAALENGEDLEAVLVRCGLVDVRIEVAKYDTTQNAADFIDTRSLMIPSRLMAKRLGADAWAAFKEQVRQRLTNELGEPFTYLATANLAVGRKSKENA